MPLIDPVTMSTPPPKAAQAATPSKPKEPVAAAPLQAVQAHETPLAQSVQYGLPVVLAALFFFRFNALVADPVSTMRSSLPIVAALQVAYVLVVLPAAGSQTTAKTPKKTRPGEKKKPSGEPIAFVVSGPRRLHAKSQTRTGEGKNQS